MLCAYVDLIIRKYKVGQNIPGTNNFKIFTAQKAGVEL
jgi:hypothetical protein